MAAYIKELVNNNDAADIIYPITKAKAVYMKDDSTTVQKAIDDINTGIININNINGSDIGYHNSKYRGKQLGTSVSDSQWTEISSGKFTDMYIGDYWKINSVDWLIAAFDYYYYIGDTNFTKHHIVIVPRTNLYDAQMKNTETGGYITGLEYNSTDGGYIGSDMRNTNLEQAISKAQAAFGENHILSHRIYIPNNAKDGLVTGGAWIDSPGVELMTEIQVYGTRIRSLNDTKIGAVATTEKLQFPLYKLAPNLMNNRQTFWLQDVSSSIHFCFVHVSGAATAGHSSYAIGVRPAIVIGS